MLPLRPHIGLPGRPAGAPPGPRPIQRIPVVGAGHARRAPPAVAALTDRGVAVDVGAFDVNAGLKSLGEGSYGQVYETTMTTPTTGPIRVVLKRMKPRVANAAAFFDAEHLVNVYAARKARGGVASFYGYVDVPPEAAGRQLSAGTWLVWRYEGDRTLAEFLRRRDCEAALAEALGLPADLEPGVLAATAAADVLGALSSLHAAGVVHRDVKPANLILADTPPGGWPEGEGGGGRRVRPPPPPPRPRLVLVDLGAAADLRYGTNFDPAESVLDPLYAPPERFVLPSDEAPALGDAPGLLSSRVLSPLVWSRWRPDAFDAYSAGLVLLQVALPRLRSPAGLRAFNAALARAGGDLAAWRAGARLPASETAALDAGGGAGWDLAAALLAPRAGLEATPGGGVSFFGGARGGGGGGGSQAARPTAAAALRHPFIARLAVPVRSRAPVAAPAGGGGAAAAPAVAATVRRGGGSAGSSARSAAASTSSPPPPSRSSSAAGLLTGTAAAVWRAASKRLFALEGRLLAQSEAVATQTTRVQAAAAAAAAAAGGGGADRAAAAALAREQAALAKQQAALDGLAAEFEAAAAGASEQLAGLLPGDGPAQDPAARARAALAADQKGAAAAAAAAAAPPPPQTPTPSPVAAAITSAAVGGLAGALRWTGTALRVATALAAQVADGASRAAEEEAARAEALKVDRDAGLAFVEALKALTPPPGPGDAWDADVKPRLARDKRVTRMSPAAAAALYEAYAAARDRAAAARAAEAQREFAAAVAAAAIPPSVPWADAERVLGADPATADALAAGLDPAALYSGLQAAAAAEAAFNDLLAETIGTTKRGAPWRALRPSICDDPRFAPVDEMRRRALFAAARAAHDAAAAAAEAAEAEAAAARAAEVARARQEQAAAAAALEEVAPPPPPPPPPATTATTDAAALAEEQRRLRAEYERMEAKLRAMEAALAASAAGGGVGGVNPKSVSPVPGAVDADEAGQWVTEVEEEA